MPDEFGFPPLMVMEMSKEDVALLLRELEKPAEPNENLVRLFQGLPPKFDGPKHVYQKEQGCGIGFCTVCFSDDWNDGQHFEEVRL